jgi:hypothetical protein
LQLETAVSESRPDVQDDIQAIDEQQGEEIWIDPDMKEHPVAHWDGLDDDKVYKGHRWVVDKTKWWAYD